MPPTMNALHTHDRTLREAAERACDAAHAFACRANGTLTHVIAAPTAYHLLGEVKVLLWHLEEVISSLPAGLDASLGDERITVYDRDLNTGRPRDAAAQVALASSHLTQLAGLLGRSADQAEAAQTALTSQGWTPTGEEE